MRTLVRGIHAALLPVALLAVAGPLAAAAGAATVAEPTGEQTSHPEPTAASTVDTPAAVATPASPDYLLPDLAPKALVHDGKRFWFKPIFAVVLDYTLIDQDAAGVEQVGLQEDAGELRAGRVGGTLRSKGSYAWDFYATFDYQERATRDKTAFQVYDLKIGLPIGKAKLEIGKGKQPLSYELSGLSVLLPHQERILLPFYQTRSIGVKLAGPAAGDRMTWAVGAFNDYFDSNTGKNAAGNDYVGHLTALAYESPSKTDYLHLGAAYMHRGNDDGKMRFAGRPESNVVDKILDTGNFAADHADELGLELLIAKDQFSLLAERFDASVDSPQTGDPDFYGYYVAGSWVITGESRPYNRAVGYAGGIRPFSRYGAAEVVAKFSHVDLTDRSLDGGVLDKWYFGFNWWISTQWKLGVGYGNGDLDKDGVVGNLETLLFRAQWLY